MFLVAESGATKTDWRLVKGGSIVESFVTSGFNPFFTAPEFIVSELEPVIRRIVAPEHVNSVFFYGAGCSSAERCAIIEKGLTTVLPKAIILIDTDLSAAVKSLFPNDEGIAVILGTGSNSAYCKSGEIIYKLISPGYILGDEGSGNHMGRILVKSWMQEELPHELALLFEAYIAMPVSDVLDHIYRKPFPNRYLASLCRFISANKEDPYCQKIINQSFAEFFQYNLRRYKEFPNAVIRCTGGIAYEFRNELSLSAGKHGAVIESVIPSPVDALVRYHLEQDQINTKFLI